MKVETVRDLGEFGLIDRLLAVLPEETRASREEVPVAAGDDAAVMRVSAGGSQIVTTDALVEGIHFRLDWTDWESLGHKALAVNVSDIAAMGGLPTVAVVTLGLRGDEQVPDLEALYRGMGELAQTFGMVIVGGDIVRVTGERFLSITALGRAPNGRVLLRSGARPGDVIGITGTIGASAAGLEILKRPQDFENRVTAARLVDAHLRPVPRVEAGQLLVEHRASAAMDLSDGLAGDLPKILVASGVSAEIAVDALPVIAAVRALFPDRWRELALAGGEDYELLFTIPPERWTAFADAALRSGVTVTRVGAVVPAEREPELRVLGRDGEVDRRPIDAFDHFRGI